MPSPIPPTTSDQPSSRRRFLSTLGLGGAALAAPQLLAQAEKTSVAPPPPPPPPTTPPPPPAAPALAPDVFSTTGWTLPPRLPATIPTLTGVTTAGTLGTTLMHEHILHGTVPEDKHEESIAFATRWLADAARVGIETIVDLSPNRDIRLYTEIARRSPVRIIASTGSYLFKQMPVAIQQLSEADMEARMLREATEGIDGSGIRAGIIKVACNDHELSPWEEMVFRCAARVNRATGIPIGTHAVRSPRVQFDFLVKNGANPRQLFFSHVEAKFGWQGRTREQQADYLLAIAKEGGRLLFNNFGYDFHTPWEDLVFIIRHLCDHGHAGAVLISIDAYWYWNKGNVVIQMERQFPQTRERTYAYMMTHAVPALLKAGLSAAEIQTFLVANPRAYFAEAGLRRA